MNRLPIVVLTPVKNEEWILDRFLSVTSEFADTIIIADQGSTDKSRDIAQKFHKVYLINNTIQEYDESSRQKLLIEKARELIPGKKILLALDADEIMTAQSLYAKEWDLIYSASPGTVIFFEKPDIIFPTTHCIRHKDYFPLGYIDDGAIHEGKKIHSPRIPIRITSKRLYIEQIKFMHYALTRPIEYRSRQRYYSVIENVYSVGSFYRRLIKYSPSLAKYIEKNKVTETPKIWFEVWENKGINMTATTMSPVNFFNLEVLKMLSKYGTMRFYFDDIWDLDWATFSKEVNGSDIRAMPGLINKFALKVIVKVIALLKKIVNV